MERTEAESGKKTLLPAVMRVPAGISVDKTCNNNKKTTCQKCGHVIVNGYCKGCFLKDIKKADEMLNKAQKVRIKFEAGYQIKRQKAITILIIIITISIIIGFCVGWLICYLGFQ